MTCLSRRAAAGTWSAGRCAETHFSVTSVFITAVGLPAATLHVIDLIQSDDNSSNR